MKLLPWDSMKLHRSQQIRPIPGRCTEQRSGGSALGAAERTTEGTGSALSLCSSEAS